MRQSEESILAIAKTTHEHATTHLAAMAAFGLTEAMLTQFQTDIDTAEAMKSETDQRIALRLLTVDKEDALDACVLWGRQLRTRLQLAFGRGSVQAQSFPAEAFNRGGSSERMMMPVMETLISLAHQYSTALTDYGQDETVIAQGETALADLRTADSQQELKKDHKRAATQERGQAFQVLYDTVNRINKIGRMVFEGDPVNLTLFESKWTRRHAAVEEDVLPV